MRRVLLDTDVTLDYVQQRTPFEIEANEIFDFLNKGEFIAYLAPITLINVFYFARKATDAARARLAVEKLLTIVEVCSVSKTVLHDALSLKITDYEDAVQHACAEAENLDAIVTRNSADYKNAIVKVYSPTEFLSLLKTK